MRKTFDEYPRLHGALARKTTYLRLVCEQRVSVNSVCGAEARVTQTLRFFPGSVAEGVALGEFFRRNPQAGISPLRVESEKGSEHTWPA